MSSLIRTYVTFVKKNTKAVQKEPIRLGRPSHLEGMMAYPPYVGTRCNPTQLFGQLQVTAAIANSSPKNRISFPSGWGKTIHRPRSLWPARHPILRSLAANNKVYNDLVRPRKDSTLRQPRPRISIRSREPG